MGNRRHVRYVRYLESSGVQRPHGRIAPRSRAFYVNIEVFHPIFIHRLPHLFRSNLRRKRGTLARSLKAAAPGAGPAKGVSLSVCDSNNGVIERGVDMCHTVHYRLFYAFTRASFWSCHFLPNRLLFADNMSRSLTTTRVGARALPADRQSPPMAYAPITPEIHQPLDVHGDFPS